MNKLSVGVGRPLAPLRADRIRSVLCVRDLRGADHQISLEAQLLHANPPSDFAED